MFGKHDKLISETDFYEYFCTRAEADDVARELRREGTKCAVVNLSGARSRRKTYDKPWQVRTYKSYPVENNQTSNQEK